MSTKEKRQWRHILCPIDFSKRSSVALETAVALARRDDAMLSLVHVIRPVPAPVGSAEPASMPALATASDAEKLTQALRRQHESAMSLLVKHELPEGISSQQHMLVGRPADELAAFAEAESVDLVVMATQGHGRWQRFLFGSVTERLLKLSPCAVLVLPIE